jgi:hypothetical protein
MSTKEKSLDKIIEDHVARNPSKPLEVGGIKIQKFGSGIAVGVTTSPPPVQPTASEDEPNPDVR